MTATGRRSAVSTELALAAEELDGVRSELGQGRLRLAVRGLNFAAFHLALALVFHDDEEPRSHAGVRHVFHQRWVLAGRAERRWTELLTRLQRQREQADYDGSGPEDEASVRADLAAVEELLAFTERAVGDE